MAFVQTNSGTVSGAIGPSTALVLDVPFLSNNAAGDLVFLYVALGGLTSGTHTITVTDSYGHTANPTGPLVGTDQGGAYFIFGVAGGANTINISAISSVDQTGRLDAVIAEYSDVIFAPGSVAEGIAGFGVSGGPSPATVNVTMIVSNAANYQLLFVANDPLASSSTFVVSPDAWFQRVYGSGGALLIQDNVANLAASRGPWTITDSDGSATSWAADIYAFQTVPAASLECGNPPLGSLGVAYSYTFTATGGTPAFTYSITAGSLPPGLALNGTTGAVTGVPTATGTFDFTIHVVDSNSSTADASCSISVVIPGCAAPGAACPAVPSNPYTTTLLLLTEPVEP